MNLFDELKHRNVFKVAVAYAVTGWLLAQIADLVVDAFNLPDRFLQMIIILLVLGFPLALFFAWVFELTPEGVKKARDLPADMPKDPRSGRILNRVTIVTLLVAVALLGWDKLHGPTGEIDTAVTDKSIAVLPFADFSPGGDQAWFADGLTEEILNALARTPDLDIASRTSSFAYRGTTDDIPAIAAQLGVAHILEGSVRRAGDRLRVTAQLIRAADDKHLWSENFDGSSEDSIEIQERIAFEIASALQTAMDPDELSRMVSAGTRSVEAWETYLKGLAAYQYGLNSGSKEKVFEAIELFEQAVEVDPGFTDAYLRLADLWQSQIDPTTTVYADADIPLAERRAHYLRAIDGAAKNARTEMMRLEAELRVAGFELRVRDQIALAKQMTELEPGQATGWGYLAFLYVMTGEYDQARSAILTAWPLTGVRDEYGKSFLVEFMQRASVDGVMPLVNDLLKEPKLAPGDLYQAHRALLAAGEIEQAAGVAAQFLRMAGDSSGRTLVRIRQACAEGRVSDADRIYEEAGPGTATRWLYLKTLGRDEEARTFLQPLDTPETLSVLAGYLGYVSFEARDFPVMWQALTAQDVHRPPARPLRYRCQR
jgi:TolB-like protein